MNIGVKVWLEKDGKTIFGLGKVKLLKAIEREGSISKASKVTGISFRRAWKLLEDIETNLGINILEKKRGGKNGGYTRLTTEAKELLAKFEDTADEIIEFARESYNIHFSKNKSIMKINNKKMNSEK